MDIQHAFVVLLQVCISGLLPFIQQVASQGQGSSVCPYNWQPYNIGNKVTCLWLSDEKTSWINAMNWCRLMDGQLVELKSQAFNTLLARMIAVKNTGKYWIGLTNMENERVFKWMTSKETVNPMDPRMSFFKPGQQLSGQPKHCVHTDEKGEWTVESCKAQFWFICQKNNRFKGSSKKVRTRL